MHITAADLAALETPVHLERLPAPPSPDDQTLATVLRMSQAALAASRHPLVQQATREALAALPDSTDPAARAVALYWWVKRRLRFVPDPPEDELLIEPPVLLSLPDPRGDCDDYSILLAAMLLAAGIPAEFITVAGQRDEPRRFSHVYVRALLPDGPLALDASHGPEPGWEASPVWRRQRCPITPFLVCHEEPLSALGATAEVNATDPLGLRNPGFLHLPVWLWLLVDLAAVGLLQSRYGRRLLCT